MPRMTTVQRTAIATPATGLQVYDTDTNSQWYYNGTVWVNAALAGQKWVDGATAGDIELVNPTGTESIKFTDKGFKEISKTLTTIPTLSGLSYLNNPITDYNMYNHKYYKSSEIPLNLATSNIAFVQNMALIDGADTRTATSNILTENALTIDPSNSTTYSSATANFNKLLHYGTGFTTNLFADSNYTRLGYGGTATNIYGSYNTVDFRGAGTTTNHAGVYSSPQINNASGTITNVIGYRTYFAFGSSSTNISNLFVNNADYGGIGASYTGTITNSYDFYANNFNPIAATVTNKFGIYSNGIDKNNSLLGNLLVGNSANSATAKADASAQLEVKSTTKGFLMPRMTTTQRTAIATPATGLQVYDTTTNSQWFYNGTVWVQGASKADGSKFTNDAANTRVALTNLSDGTTARPTGTEYLISDNGNLTIGKSIPNIYKISVKGTTNNNTAGLAEFTNSDNTTIFSLRNDGKIVFGVPDLPANINQNVTISKDFDNSTIAPAPWTSTTATALRLSNQFGTTGTVGTSVGVQFALYDGENAFIDAQRPSQDFVNLRFGFRTSLTGSYVERMVINSDGNVGIGLTAPTEKLEVNGAIKIGSTSAVTPTAGTIRFNTTTSKFEGYDGTTWVAFH